MSKFIRTCGAMYRSEHNFVDTEPVHGSRSIPQHKKDDSKHMQHQDSYQSAFKKLSLAPKALVIAAGAGLMLTANAGPGRAFSLNDGDIKDAAMIVASYSSTTVVTFSSTVSYSSSSVVSSSTVSTSSSSSSSSTEGVTVNGTAFNQPSAAFDLTTTA